MRIFWLKLVSTILIVFLLFVYNHTVEARQHQEEIESLNAKLKETELLMAAEKENTQENSPYADGSYRGEGKGFGGKIEVELTILNGSITEINILSADNEDGAYLNMAKKIISDIINEQSADVDTISGATFSSTGIRQAAETALEKAEKTQ